MKIIDGRKLRDEMLVTIKTKVAALPFQPIFCDVLIGEDPASLQYVRMKAKMAESVGMRFHQATFPASITTSELIQEIKKLNIMEYMCGIIIQLPLPSPIDMKAVLDAIDPRLDVDCLGAIASARFYSGTTEGGLPTALACIKILESLDLDLKNPSTPLGTSKKIVVVGQGQLVGKPVAALLILKGLKPVAIDSTTPDKAIIIKNADVIISGIGKGKYITGEMIKEGAVLIDAGTSESGAGIVGDVDLQSVQDKASVVSPVPGGVGPVTVACLLNNVLSVAESYEHHTI